MPDPSSNGAITGLGGLIRTRRLGHGWTQAELAVKVGVHPETVSRWERDERDPTIPNAKSLARRLGGRWKDYVVMAVLALAFVVGVVPQ